MPVVEDALLSSLGVTACLYTRGGVTKSISSVPLFSLIFSTVKTHVIYWVSRLYVTGVAAA